MCTVSMVGDHYNEWWPKKYPDIFPSPGIHPKFNDVTREEFEALRRDVEEMKALLKRAKDYDERNNEPHCQMEEKVALLKKVADMVGVDLGDVFEGAAP